ncbi:MAG: hypothetical protein IPN39_08745 [Chitinophagaceae bacterium]|nr:hypothetical protein [Chitinophagaceae bacterium]MBK9381405.1 hypothetical protein [Chitinophagaceae bacterium]
MITKIIYSLPLLISSLAILLCSCSYKNINGYKIRKFKKEEIYTKYHVEIVSNTSNIKSFIEGKVIKIIRGFDDYSILITKDSLTHCFSKLETINVNEGDFVVKGQKLGNSLFNKELKRYQFDFLLSTNNIPIHYFNILRFLQNKKMSDYSIKEKYSNY